MADSVIAIDANAIENLWAGGGAKAWDQLVNGADYLLVSDIVLEELEEIPLNSPAVGLAGEFRTWMQLYGIQEVDFEVDGLRYPVGHPDAGDLQ